MGCIYIATCKINGKSYIGKTNKVLRKRMLQHVACSKRDDGFAFHRAIARHGEDAFLWSVLAQSDDETELFELEKKFIASMRTVRPGGYNLTPGGDGVHYDDELRKEHSAACKRRSQNPEWLRRNREVREAERGNEKIQQARIEGQKRWMGTPQYAEMMERRNERFRNDPELRKKFTAKSGTDEWRRAQADGAAKNAKNPEWLAKVRAVNAKLFSKRVVCVETGVVFDSATEAGKIVGLAGSGNITAVCRGIRATAAGFHWRYDEEKE